MANNALPSALPLILTRPRTASETFLASLDAPVRDRLLPLFSPLIEIVTLPATVHMTSQDAAVFSSANGVEAGPPGAGRTAYCVGPATTQAARNCGWNAVQAGQNADELVASLIAMRPAQRLFHLSGQHTRGDIAGRLTAAGLRTTHAALYDQRLCPMSAEAKAALVQCDRVIVPLFSPRTATQFVKTAPRTESAQIVALSPAVADALGPVAVDELIIARRPDAQAMGSALAELIHRN